MGNEELEKLLHTAAESETVTILLSDDAGDKDILAAWTIKEKLGSRAVLANIPDVLQERWRFLLGSFDRPKKEVTLSLDVEKNPIEELRYEKEGGRLKIYLSPQFPLRAEDFLFEESYHPSDVVIALGFRSKEDLKNKLREVPLKNPEAIVPIGRTLNEMDGAAGTTGPRLPPDAMKLWARALLRSSVDTEERVFWAFLPKDDFQKTNQNASILLPLLAAMKRVAALPDTYVLLWQDPASRDDKVQALVEAEDDTRRARLAAYLQMPITTVHLTLGPYANFSEAELEIRKLFKAAL